MINRSAHLHLLSLAVLVGSVYKRPTFIFGTNFRVKITISIEILHIQLNILFSITSTNVVKVADRLPCFFIYIFSCLFFSSFFLYFFFIFLFFSLSYFQWKWSFHVIVCCFVVVLPHCEFQHDSNTNSCRKLSLWSLFSLCIGYWFCGRIGLLCIRTDGFAVFDRFDLISGWLLLRIFRWHFFKIWFFLLRNRIGALHQHKHTHRAHTHARTDEPMHLSKW